MKILTKIGVVEKGISNGNLNIQKINTEKENNEISMDNFTKSKKIKIEIKKIDEIKTIKNDELVRGNVILKDNNEQKLINYSDYLSLKYSRQAIITITKNIFDDIKIQLINIDNLKEQTNLKIHKSKEILKKKERKNIIEHGIPFRIYIVIFLIKSLLINYH